MSSKCRCYHGVPGKRNARVHFAATVASRFARFKSGRLQRVEHTAREGVQNVSLISTTSNILSNQVDAVISAAVRQWRGHLSVDVSRRAFLALLLILTLCFCDNCGL